MSVGTTTATVVTPALAANPVSATRTVHTIMPVSPAPHVPATKRPQLEHQSVFSWYILLGTAAFLRTSLDDFAHAVFLGVSFHIIYMQGTGMS